MSTTRAVLQEKTITTSVRKALASAIMMASLISANNVLAAQLLSEIPKQHYALTAGNLGTALTEFAANNHLAFSFDPQLTNHLQHAAIEGTYSGSELISLLLKNSGLTLITAEDGSYSLIRSTDKNLPEVVVRGNNNYYGLPETAAGGQVAQGSRLGMLGNKDVMDTPFNTTAFTAQTIANQQSKTLTSVLENDPSVRFTTSAGHAYENYTIRGFNVDSTNLAWNGLYGIAPDGHVPTEMFERVELLKGPGALLFGMSPGGAVGGIINLVPKKAEDTPLTRITTTWSSKTQLGVNADVGQRFGEEKRLGIRVNGGYSYGKGVVDDQKKRHELASVVMDYQGDNWNAELDAYTLRDHTSNGSPVMVGFRRLGHVIDAPDAKTNLFKGIYTHQDSSGIVLRGEANLNHDWTLFGAVGAAEHKYRGYLNGTRVVLLDDTGNGSGQTYNQAGYTHNKTAEVGVKTSFNTGSIRHDAVFSVNTLLQTGGRYTPVPESDPYTTNIYNPIAASLAPSPGDAKRTTDNEISSLALADTLSMLQDKVQLTLGARIQRVKQKMSTPSYNESATTPAVGLVVKPWGENISLYANYIEGLSAGSTVGSTYKNSGETFAPYKTKQKEVGIKWENGDFTQTVDIFQIEQPSYITTSDNYLALNGKQRNRGLEWNAFGNLTSHTRLLGGIAYIQAKQVSTQGGAQDGYSVYGVPRWTANLGGEWDSSWAPGLTFNGRVIYTGKQWLDSDNTMRLPSWTRVDLGARYRTHLFNKDVVFRGNIQNVFNRNYWSGTFNDTYATVGEARSFQVSASVDF